MAKSDANISAENEAAISNIAIVPPEKFNFQCSSDWPEWIQEFEDFRCASGLCFKSDKMQVCTLLYIMGRESRKILSSLQLSPEDSETYEVVKKSFDSHFVIRHNEVYESAKFNLRKQREGETVDQFSTALFGLAEHCNFGTLKNRLIRDRFVVGLLDKGLSENLQLDAELILETALEKARQREAVKVQQQDLLQISNKVSDINFVKFKSRQESKAFSSTKNAQNPKLKYKTCGYCGGQPHMRSLCPANNSICRACKKRGHFGKVCKTRNFKHPQQNSTVAEVFNAKPTELDLGGINTSSQNSLHVDILFNNEVVNFKVDSGAEVSVVSPNTPGIPQNLQKSTEILRGPDGTQLKVIGKFQACLNYKNRNSNQELFVIKNVKYNLLGWPALKDLQIIKLANSVENTNLYGKEYYKSKYPELFTGLGKMSDKHCIILEPNAIPYSLSVARRVPIPLRKKVKEELDKLEAAGVIRRITKPTKWCAGLVPVKKPSGDVRICVDFTKLNKHVVREKTLMPTTEESLGLLGDAKIFSKLDANSGFFQIPLVEDSQELTTFITPYGRYCFTRLPFGITSAPEHFQAKMSRILEGLPGVVNQTDDTLIFGKNEKEHNDRLETVLKRLMKAGVTLNYEKCCFSVPSVKFLGHIIDKDGIQPDPSKVSAIKNLKKPNDVSGVRRILGIINHVARFLPHLSTKSEPLRALLNKNVDFIWDSQHDKALQEIKDILCSPICLAKYHPDYETILSADASSFGLGAVLMQKQPNGDLRAVAYASRSLIPAETRYSQIEKEALAATWGAERFNQFLMGLHFTLETDHKPLISLFGKMNLEDLPPRIQRFRIRLMRFDYDIVYIPGDKLATADALSRSPEENSSSVAGELTEDEVTAYVSYVINSIPASPNRLNEIREELKKDGACSIVMELCTKGWPDYKDLPHEAGPYWKYKDELTVWKGLLLKGRRLVIPKKLQKDIMSRIHDGHLGITKCRERAKEAVWWPGISAQIKEMVTCCSICVKCRQQNAEPLIPSIPPSRPWEKVGTDLFENKNKHFLLVTDYYSRFPEVCHLPHQSSSEVIRNLKEVFSRHGIPEMVVSDNGPQYSSHEFKTFANNYGFQHITSSPKYPQGNGEAERMVQTLKNLMNKSEDFHLALLVYRNTPGPTGSSPAQLCMGRRLKTRLPTLPSQLSPKWINLKQHRQRDVQNKIKQKSSFDKRHAAHELTDLKPGDTVWVPDMKKPGIISAKHSPRSFITKTDTGELRRNRRHLVPMKNEFEEKTEVQIPENAPDPPADHTTTPKSIQKTPYKTRSGRVVKRPERLDL